MGISIIVTKICFDLADVTYLNVIGSFVEKLQRWSRDCMSWDTRIAIHVNFALVNTDLTESVRGNKLLIHVYYI